MVRSVLRRLGTAGVILLASLVFYAVLGGVAVVHRLQATNTATVQQQAGAGERDDQRDQPGKHDGHSKPKHPNHGHGGAPQPGENEPEPD